jgi:LacI family transcriptional regulator, repressor for deo operon, udp, cdd, tsx, nupC, and nupG
MALNLSGSKMSTIEQVARAAGVSTATVSRTLSNPDIVSEVTRRKVQGAVAALRYSPNAAARSLRTLKSGKLLVTVPDIANPFFSLIIQGIEETAHREGYAVLLGDAGDEEEREERYALLLQRKEAEGLIFLGHRLPKSLRHLVSQPGPIAPIVNGCEFSPTLGVPSVHIDNAAAARDAMSHLYGLGHRRIGVITGPLVSPLSRQRLHGVKSSTSMRQSIQQLTVIQGDFSIESGLAGAADLMGRKDPPTAIFCFNDEMAIGVLHHARTNGLRVPTDLSVIGFDDIRFAKYLVPTLTTVSQPMLEIGQETVRLMLEILRGAHKRPKSVTLPHKLMVRDSTDKPR